MESCKSNNNKKVLTANEYYGKLDCEYNSKYQETEEEFWSNLGISYNDWVKEWEKVKFD
jgi:hypothetical protein